MHLRGLEGFGRSGGFQIQMYQHRGSGLGMVSLACIARNRDHLHSVLHTKELYTIDFNIISVSVCGQWQILKQASQDKWTDFWGWALPLPRRRFLRIPWPHFEAIRAQAIIVAYLRSAAHAIRRLRGEVMVG
jgi:hypothetical protein